MTSRERVLAALSHKETDRVPFSLYAGINDPAKAELASYLNMKSMRELDRYLDGLCDMKMVLPGYIGPRDRETGLPDGSYVDSWGVVRVPVSFGAGYYNEISHYPLAGVKDIKELDGFRWPESGWYDYDSMIGRIDAVNQGNERAIMAANGLIFERAWYMRGFDRFLMDLVLEPELAWEILRRVTDFHIGFFKRVFERAPGKIDLVLTADDVGHQNGLLVSPDVWVKMIKPHHARMNKVLHEYGVKIMYHSDGAIMPLVPGLIDMGVDILEPLQFDAKDMDAAELKRLYGDRLCFHGGISVQKTLPFGTPEEVRNEVRERIRVLGKNGGYILSSAHVIQANTPPENIAAFLEESHRIG